MEYIYLSNLEKLIKSIYIKMCIVQQIILAWVVNIWNLCYVVPTVEGNTKKEKMLINQSL